MTDTLAPVAELRDVSVVLRNRTVLEGIDLTIPARQYLAIIGPNGGGKTTLLKVLLGLIAPRAGWIRVCGRAPRRVRGRVGYVPQAHTFHDDFPIRVLDVVLMGCLARKPFGRVGDTERQAAMEALERVGLAGVSVRPLEELSGGQRQRALIARALVGRPELLLLDEPTSSLDDGGGRTVWELFAELSRRMAVVVVSHDLGAVSAQVDCVACLNRRLFRHPSSRLEPEVVEAAFGYRIDVAPNRCARGPLPERRSPNR